MFFFYRSFCPGSMYGQSKLYFHETKYILPYDPRGSYPQGTVTKKHPLLVQLLRLAKKDFLSVNFTISILGQNFAFWRKSVFFYAFLETRDFLGFLIFVISMQKVKFTWDMSREKMMNLFQHFVVISLMLEWGRPISKFNSGPLPIYSPISSMYPGAISPLWGHQGPYQSPKTTTNAPATTHFWLVHFFHHQPR